MGDHKNIFGTENDVGSKTYSLEYRHSDPALMDAETESRYISRFQPRVSKYVAISQEACIECQIDLFGTGSIGKVVGGLSAHTADFTALCAPEALPERIGLCSYFIEYAFVHDDMSVDAVQGGQDNDVQKNRTLSQALGPKRLEDLQDIAGGGLKRKQARAKIWAVLNEIDQDYLGRCQRTFKQWHETGQQMRDEKVTNLEDYLAGRALECGANWVVRMMGWASGVELTREEEVETGPVTYLAFVVLAVTNDLWSWEKEKRVTRRSGDALPLINAVHMVMQMQDTTEETAKQTVHNIICEHEKQYCLLRDKYLGRPCTSMSVRKWFQVLELSMAGNALWSIHTPRYHLDVRDPYICPPRTPSVFRELHVMGLKPEAMKNGEIGLGSASATGPVYKDLEILDETVLWKPYKYIASMPSKGFRHHLIDALQTCVLFKLTCRGHRLDDIQDASCLRRGRPAAHEIFGVGQTVNSACFHINNALRLVQHLSSSAVLIFSEQMARMYTGQGHDIFWATHRTIPTEEEYFRMVDGSMYFRSLTVDLAHKRKETGGLFLLILRLMQQEATQNRDLDACRFMYKLGRYYQIRDDYQNLVSQEYTSQRGFCQDLDEKKLSFPFIRACNNLEDNTVLREWLNVPHSGAATSMEAKRYILARIEESQSLEDTQNLLALLLQDLEAMLRDMESRTGQENWILRSMMVQLQIKPKRSLQKESTFTEGLRVWGGYRDAAWRLRNLN
ncbi:hypothetical protein ASPCAL02958 [Aspergillus calidoustus]|uniref:Geranylgeranyl pyrophosphate synthase n=1 Tax=Aspergillus calidoustus TaxID=454130 RepID=A0A0U5GLZ3_ASPCI|nr:hypothetical protein ASPCAL02958 [Aspergillus calidoustus]